MASKNLVCIQLGGGMDGVNFLSPRDAASVARVQDQRKAAPSNILDYTDTVLKFGTVTAGSNIISNLASLTGIEIGQHVFNNLNAASLPALRNLTVQSLDSSDGANLKVVMSDVAYISATTVGFTFRKPSQLFPLTEPTVNARKPALHYTQKFLTDAFNTEDTLANAGKVKAAIVANVGPLRKKLFLFNGQLRVVGATVNAIASEVPANLTSHNDQTSTVQANTPEGAVEGWGGGIADNFLSELSGINVPMASVSVSNLPPFSAGSEAVVFSISPNGLISKIPDFVGKFTREPVSATQIQLTDLFKTAMTTVEAGDDLSASAVSRNTLAKAYQPVLNDVMQITDIPDTLTKLIFNISGSTSVNASSFARNMRSIARMILANNPNRGFTATRIGTTVTLTTEKSEGVNVVANRVAGTTKVTVSCPNHLLFTSNLGTNTSDSVIILTKGVAIDGGPPANGYKIVLEPSDENNKFTFETPGFTGALTNVEVSVQLKHNFTTFSPNAGNKVFIDGAGFDSSSPLDGYEVKSTPTTTIFTLDTTASGAFSGTTLNVKAKLISLTKQVYYAETAGFSWDSHPEANHSQLAALDAVCAYFNSLISRMADADTTTFISTEFGRTFSTNSVGTDHGWGNNFFVFGKSVRGNKVYGDIMDYTSLAGGGLHLYYDNMFMPTTSIYQYAATFAKWMGSTDAQIVGSGQSVGLFPDLNNWPISERKLGFLDPLV